MATNRKDLETRLIATDDASKVVDKVADKYEAIPDKVDTTISADDQATPQLRSIVDRLDGLSKEDQLIVLKANARDAQREIDRILRALGKVHDMDDEEVQIRIEALNKAKGDLDQVQAEIADLDGESATVNVEAPGLDDIVDKLGDLPGLLGAIASAGGPTAALGALVAAATGVATGFADAATEVRTMMQLTGASAEEASRLQAVWKTTGADVNDLNDIVVQLNGALQQSPDLASKIGINLDDGRTALQRLVQVIDLADQGLISMTDQSTLFGEEGIRQVAALTSQTDDLATSMARVGEGQVFTEDELRKAQEVAKRSAEVAAAWESVKNDLGEIAAGPLADVLSQITGALSGLESLVSGDAFKPEFWDAPRRGGQDLLGIGDKSLQQEYDRRKNAEEINDVIKTGIDLAIQAGDVEADRADSAEDQAAQYGIALSRITSVADVQNEAKQVTLDTAAAYADILLKVKDWETATDNVQLALDEALKPLEDGTAAAEAFGGALDEVGRTKGLDTLEQFGDTEEAISDMFGVIKDNKGVIPDIFDTSNARSREFRDSLEALATSYKENLQQVITDTGGDFDKVRERARELRSDLRERVAIKVGVDLEHATPEERKKVEALVNAVIPTDKEIQLGIKIAEKDLLKIKTQLAIENLKTLLPATALQMQVDLAEGDIGPKEAAATAQEILNENGVEVDLGVNTKKADDTLVEFADKERAAKLGVVPTGLADTNTAIQAGPNGNGWSPIKVPVIPVYPSGSGGGGGAGTLAAPTGRSVSPVAATGAGMAPIPIPVAAPAGGKSQVVNFYQTFNAAAMGAPFDIATQVDAAMRQAARLFPVTP